MSEEERSKQGEDTPDLIKNYEQMLLNDESRYFDIHQFETIIDYYFEDNEFENALEAVFYANSIFENSPELLLLEAQVNIAIGRLTRSINILKSVLNIQPSNDEAHVMIASLYSQLRESKKAIIHLEKAIEFSDDFMKDELFLDLALEFENIDEYRNAIGVLKQALRGNVENEAAIYEICFCYEELKEYEESVSYFKSFIEDTPYSFPAWYAIGNMYLKLEKYQDAVTSFDFCTLIQEDFTPGLINLATAYMLVGAYENSISTLERALKNEGENPEILNFIGECYEKMNMPEEALTYFQTAKELAPNNPESIVGLAIALIDLERVSEALPLLENGLKIHAKNLEIALVLAEVYVQLKMSDDADHIFENLLESHPKSLKVREVLFDHNFLHLNDLHLSLECVVDGLFYIPDSSRLLNRKLIALFALGKRNEGIDLLHQLISDKIFDRELIMEIYPELFEDPRIIELIKS